MQNRNMTVSTRTVTTITVNLSEALDEANVAPGDEVELVLTSAAMSREATPIKLSYTTLMRLTRDA